MKFEFGVTIDVMKSCYLMAPRSTHPKEKTPISEKMAESIRKALEIGFLESWQRAIMLVRLVSEMSVGRYTGEPSVSIDVDKQQSSVFVTWWSWSSEFSYESIRMQQNSN